ncbi:MAG: hypothetical protein FJ267_04985 [Planctomycetes bacterium]|nr:hypothetical protein [Planctomycetota bacterium]
MPWPDNVFVFDHKKPQSLRHPQFPVVLHGMSYSKREMNANLVPLYPDPDANVANIGLLHSSTSGNANHDVYAPCSIEELAAKGYDYWALGHIHEFAILHQHPHVVYSGNTQGRHARETGVKGCVLVTLSRSTNDQYAVTGLDFQETDVVRWFREKITLEPDDDDERLLDKTRTHLRSLIANADGRLAAVRLEYEGRCEAHRLLAQDASRQQIIATIRSLAADFGDDVWIEKIRFQTQSPLDLDALRERQDLIGDLLRDIQVKMTDPSELT